MDGNICNPMRFFEEFLPNGFNKLYQEFLDYGKDLRDFKMLLTTPPIYDSGHSLSPYPYEVLVHDETTDCKIVEERKYRYCVQDDNYIIIGRVEHKRNFPQELDSLLYSELEKAIQAINEAVLRIRMYHKEEIIVFIDLVFSQTFRIIEEKLVMINAPRYIQQCQSVLILFFQKIEKLYPDYIKNTSSGYQKCLTPKKGTKPNKNHSFEMIPAKLNILNKLLEMLQDEKFIADDLSLELFQKAFDGSKLETIPLGIQWMRTHKGGDTYLGSLVRLIDLLEKKEYILKKEDQQISNIFVKKNNIAIKVENLSSARSALKKNLEEGKENDIIKEIESIVNRF